MTESDIDRRVRELEVSVAAQAKDIAWMRENLTLARTQHHWNIATIISVLIAGLALFTEVTRNQK